jgi:adenylosuccinate lyase
MSGTSKRLSQAQAKLGVIPADAAEKIDRAAKKSA